MKQEQWYQDLHRHVKKATNTENARSRMYKEIEEHRFRIRYGDALSDLPDLQELTILDSRTVSSVESACERVLDTNVFLLDVRSDETQFPSKQELRRYLSLHHQKSSYKRFVGFCENTLFWKEALALLHYRLFPDYLESMKCNGIIFLVDGHESRARMQKIVAHLRTERPQKWSNHA